MGCKGVFGGPVHGVSPNNDSISGLLESHGIWS